MGHLLRRMGLGIWIATIWLALAQLAGVIPAGTVDVWLWRGAWAGTAVLALGLMAGIFTPVSRELRRGHCIRCGVRIERGQTYCHDHLRQTVNEYRDRRHLA
ncbi:MAG TPA: hypothetical protein VFV75_18215 [Candidatus Polarisedimenticolaceae bacterium]|nr:hypothetical protein [Candidatus Polarisedimenticolaceae bacterium]